MSPRVAPSQPHPRRVEHALYVRCRRGEPEALVTAAYRLMDRMYTAATFVAPDESSATTAVLLAWEDTLAHLAGAQVGGTLSICAMRRLGQRLLVFGSRPAVRKALYSALHEDEEALLPLPEETVPAVVELSRHHAPQIAAANLERQALRRRLWQTAGAAMLVVLLYQGWLMAAPGLARQEVQLQCLQQRIARQELIENIRDCISELSDPQGADCWQAQTLQRVSLALEETLNAPSRQALRYSARRVEQEQLAEQLSDITEAYEGTPQRQLMQTQLLLEEMQGL